MSYKRYSATGSAHPFSVDLLLNIFLSHRRGDRDGEPLILGIDWNCNFYIPSKKIGHGNFRFALEEVGYGLIPALQKRSRSQEVDLISKSVLLLEEMEVTTSTFP